uniref:Uncharacterized protein n=1 Tax=Hyaloperonospora arabidopsidis (strain Emoy2) TaxID=559515 RepID=M4B3K4_HYAAE
MAERGDRLHEQDVASSESPPTASEDKKPSVKGTSKSKKWKWKQQQRWRKKRLVHDVKTEQDGDAHAACKDEVDTLGDAGFVMVNLQDEVEELTLEVTGEGVGSARVAAVDPKEEEKQVKRRNLRGRDEGGEGGGGTNAAAA